MLIATTFLSGAEADVIVSSRAGADFELTARPDAPQWRNVAGVTAENNAFGKPTPGHFTEIRSRWTENHLYFLFICHYQALHLKSRKVTDRETRELWEWDVAEVFVGADFEQVNRYREFQVSPQDEYLDLDINSNDLNADRDMKWDSGFTVKARIDQSKKIWYGEMKIPIASIDERPAKADNEMRVNFYRLQGPGANRKQVVWRPTNHRSHHVPESFGRLVLGD